jgi:hypothetical protein
MKKDLKKTFDEAGGSSAAAAPRTPATPRAPRTPGSGSARAKAGRAGGAASGGSARGSRSVGSKRQRMNDSDVESDDETHPAVPKREADELAAAAGFGIVNPFDAAPPTPTPSAGGASAGAASAAAAARKRSATPGRAKREASIRAGGAIKVEASDEADQMDDSDDGMFGGGEVGSMFPGVLPNDTDRPIFVGYPEGWDDDE